MKKYLSIAFVVLAVAVLSSCRKEYITQASPNQTYSTTIQVSDWAQTTDGKSDSVSIKAPAITNFFDNNGATLVYFSYYAGVYEQIPEVYNNVSYSYIHYPGNLVLYAQPPGGGTPVKPTSPITVKLVLVSSN
jgi:hypothetical protein